MSRPRVSRTVDGMRARSSTFLNAAIAAARGAVVEPGRVVRDQVHLEDLRIEQRGELARALGRVVDAGEHHVLDEHLPAAEREVAVALGQHLREREAVVHGHELRAQPRVGGVDREREPDRLLDLVDEAPQAGHPADGRDRRAAVRDPDVRQPQRRRVHLVEVEERLAHPHEDEMVDRLEPPEVQHLVEDLGGAQVAAEPHRAGGAERARERAARLRGDADRAAAVAVAHQHRLDRMPVGGAEERLHGAVRGLGLVLDRERRERERRRRARRGARAAGSSSRRSRRRRARPTPTPGGRGRPARRGRRASRSSSVRSTRSR